MPTTTTLRPRQMDYLYRRKVRKFAPLLIVFSIIYVSVIAVTPLFFQTSTLSYPEILALVFFAFWPFTFAGLAFMGMIFFRLAQPTRVTDLDSFCFYLRPFQEDRLIFEKNEVTDALSHQSNPFFLFFLIATPKNFDRFASKSLKATGHPLLSIGNPREKIPSGGSTKLYPSDFCWQFFVRRLIAKSRCVLIRCQETPSFKWELTHLAQVIGQVKLVLFIGLEDVDEAVWPVAWQVLTSAGYRLPTEFPGRGSLLRFRSVDDVVRVSRFVSTREDFSRAVQMAIDL